MTAETQHEEHLPLVAHVALWVMLLASAGTAIIGTGNVIEHYAGRSLRHDMWDWVMSGGGTVFFCLVVLTLFLTRRR